MKNLQEKPSDKPLDVRNLGNYLLFMIFSFSCWEDLNRVVPIDHRFGHIHMYSIYRPERISQNKITIGSMLEKEINQTHKRS